MKLVDSFALKLKPRHVAAIAIAALTTVGAATTIAGELGRQSPVNIVTRSAVPAYGPTITATYNRRETVEISNNWDPANAEMKEWSTLKATPRGANYVMIGSQQYNLLQFHFHTPSEHTVDGKSSAMEVHFVHLRQGALPCDENALLVIGARIQQGPPHSEFSKIFGEGTVLPQDKNGAKVKIPNFDMSRVYTSLLKSWRYDGSLTAPSVFGGGCTGETPIDEQLDVHKFPENVKWVVLNDVITMPRPQIEKFRSIFEMNSREVQDLNTRIIYRVEYQAH